MKNKFDTQNIKIPVFRGKTIKQNFTEEEFKEDDYLIKINETYYAVGHLDTTCFQISSLYSDISYSIEEDTLSIHIPFAMIDLENKEIFASLSKTLRGGDIAIHIHGNREEYVCAFIHEECSFKFIPKNKLLKEDGLTYKVNKRMKIIGIEF